jgi:N-formylglutamate amidohydrolase
MKAEQPGATAAASAPSGYSKPHEPELDPAFEVLEPDSLLCPLVFSSPHSGNVYPRRFLDNARADPAMMRRSEDAFVDDLFSGGLALLGAPLLRARFPRAYLDVNREPYELDPRMFEGRLPAFANTRSIRVAGGLGTIPRVVGQSLEIYSGRLPVEEALARIETIYKPYHAHLRRLLERARAHFGVAVLIDCHSMPSGALGHPAAPTSFGISRGDAPQKPDFVIGDRFGTSCAQALVEAIEAQLRDLGYAVVRNKPYAGGFITEHYGDPSADCHAVQIEVSRALYMDEASVSRIERFDQVCADLAKVAAALADTVGPGRPVLRAAAE